MTQTTDPTMRLHGYQTESEYPALATDDPPTDDPPTDPNAHLTDPRYLKAQEYRKAGMPVRRICRAVGISMTTYYQWFPKPEADKLRASNVKLCRDLHQLRQEGLTDLAIARRYKKHRQWVWSMIGPRSNPGPTSTVVYPWKTTAEMRAKVEKVARRMGADRDDQNVSIGSLLDMIATGDVVVRAPRRKKPEPIEQPDPVFHGSRSTRG
jgi:hypothetical protein